jgi:hypothetical protein
MFEHSCGSQWRTALALMGSASIPGLSAVRRISDDISLFCALIPSGCVVRVHLDALHQMNSTKRWSSSSLNRRLFSAECHRRREGTELWENHELPVGVISLSQRAHRIAMMTQHQLRCLLFVRRISIYKSGLSSSGPRRMSAIGKYSAHSF